MFPLRQIVKNAKRVLPYSRTMSAQSGSMVDVKVNEDEVAIVTMQRLPVNSLNLDLLQAMNTALDDLKKNKARGMILTSASPTVFSAGLDIMEMYKPDSKRVEQFWGTLQDVWIKLFSSPFPTAAAINGHSPAGGCLLAMSCEYRAMVSGKFKIGLNETALGIVAPFWFQETMRNTISTREAELALTTGRMFSVDEALKVGLIDEVASDKADAIKKCEGFLSKFENIPPLARAMTKEILRGDVVNKLAKNKDKDLQVFLQVITQPKVQQGLEFYINMLKEKKQ